MMSIKYVAAIVIALLTSAAFASSDPHRYTLPWTDKAEQLSYRSCGCADSCWVAELRERQSNKLKATLRCDCSTLLAVYPAKSPERTLQSSCSSINDQQDKMEAISATMKRMIDRRSPQ